VIIIEHNLEVIKSADHIIDLVLKAETRAKSRCRGDPFRSAAAKEGLLDGPFPRKVSPGAQVMSSHRPFM